MLITFAVAGLLNVGTKDSATLNAILVVVKVLALGVFEAIAMPHFSADNLHPFMPYGFAESSGVACVKHGVMAAAAIILYAF